MKIVDFFVRRSTSVAAPRELSKNMHFPLKKGAINDIIYSV